MARALMTRSVRFNVDKQKANPERLALIPEVGLEPTLPRETDFESVASTDSATLATAQSLPPSCTLVKQTIDGHNVTRHSAYAEGE